MSVQLLAATPRIHIVPPMARGSVDAPEQKLLGRALRVLRKRAELSSEKAGEGYGTSGEGWRKYEAGLVKSIFSPDTQHRLTAAIGRTREDLLAERARLAGEDPPDQPRISPAERMSWVRGRGAPSAELLPIVDAVQAGAWLLMDETSQVAPAVSNLAPDPRFPHARQWVSTVQGDSMNMLNIVDGDWVHCVEAADIGYYPRSGDIVRVERLRFGGQERETTLKQVEVTADAILLWPRSSNPRWKSALELKAGLADSEEIEVRIRALVLATIRRF